MDEIQTRLMTCGQSKLIDNFTLVKMAWPLAKYVSALLRPIVDLGFLLAHDGPHLAFPIFAEFIWREKMALLLY